MSKQYHAPDVAVDSTLFGINVSGKFSIFATVPVELTEASTDEDVEASVYVTLAPPANIGLSGMSSTKISSPKT